jgi:hypothetical protein
MRIHVRKRAAIDRSGRPILAHANGPDNKRLDRSLSQKDDEKYLPSFSPKNNPEILLR